MLSRLLKIMSIFLLSSYIIVLASGCNTMEGFGDDMEQAGDKIEEATDDAAQ